MLQPKRTKFRKQHKGRITAMRRAALTLNFGAYGLKAWSRSALPRARSRPPAVP
jgi:ribosomal protein L16/L10AE